MKALDCLDIGELLLGITPKLVFIPSICSTLHAKCYLNEKEAIVTSMNLYSYSQDNNDEMGIYVTKKEDPELYEEISNEAKRLLRISEEIRVSVTKVDRKVVDKKTEELKKY